MQVCIFQHSPQSIVHSPQYSEWKLLCTVHIYLLIEAKLSGQSAGIMYVCIPQCGFVSGCYVCWYVQSEL